MKYIRGSFKYQITEDFSLVSSIQGQHIMTDFVFLRPDGNLLIKDGYVSDGPSGPTFDTIIPSLYKKFLVPAFGHDALYELIRKELMPEDLREVARKMADEDLRRWCLERGMSKIRANWIYRGVRTGGGPSASPKNRRVIYEAF